MDIATAGGKKNDLTCFTILQLVPLANGQYIRNLVFVETMHGGHGFDQAIRLRQLYDDFELDYVVVDTNGVGITVYDNLVMDIQDENRGVVYEAWSCVNDESMALRSKDPDAPKVIYSIKANAQFNSDCAVMLRDGLQRKKVRLLVDETLGTDWLNTSKPYNKLSVEDQVLFQLPFLNTTSLVNEAVNLDYELINGKIRVQQPTGAHKDKYSSLSYANYIASELERKNNKKTRIVDFKFAPSCVSRISF